MRGPDLPDGSKELAKIDFNQESQSSQSSSSQIEPSIISVVEPISVSHAKLDREINIDNTRGRRVLKMIKRVCR